eukprot:12533-Pelagococcus_subviridis.AAC.9
MRAFLRRTHRRRGAGDDVVRVREVPKVKPPLDLVLADRFGLGEALVVLRGDDVRRRVRQPRDDEYRERDRDGEQRQEEQEVRLRARRRPRPFRGMNNDVRFGRNARAPDPARRAARGVRDDARPTPRVATRARSATGDRDARTRATGRRRRGGRRGEATGRGRT